MGTLMQAKPEKVTIREVARKAGVSVSTVSHALNGRGRVDTQTRARIQRVAGELGYHANRSARALRSGRTGTLGLLLPHAVAAPFAIDYYITLATATAEAAFAHDHGLLLLPTLRRPEDLARFAIDGAILCDPTANDPQIELVEAAGTPIVTVDRDMRRTSPWWVAADNAVNTRRVLDHLEEAGARRIALISGGAPLSWLSESMAAYRAWVRERRQKPLVAKPSLRALDSEAVDLAGALLDSADPPDAFFVLADRFVIGVLEAAESRGLGVPDDLLIAAGEDAAALRTGRTEVTAIDLRPAAVGRAAVEMVIARIEGTETEAPRIVPVDLCVRASTMRARVTAAD
jgi:DNA-binding LacI/PurR family transcriptional regulator